MRGKLMTKFLTTAAWAALVLGGAAAADTPPAESADMTVEENAVAEVEAPMDITAAEISSEDEGDAEVRDWMDDTSHQCDG